MFQEVWVSETRGSGLEGIIRALFSRGRGRDDLTELKLARPSAAHPLLVQSADSLLTLGVAVELLAAIGARRGVSLPASSLEVIRSQIRRRFSKSEMAHVEEEVLHILIWLEAVLSEAGAAREPEPEPASTKIVQTLVREAIADQADLYLELLDDGRLKRIRLRPERLVEHLDDPTAQLQAEQGSFVVGRHVPLGYRMTLPLEAVRWVMVVRRFSDLPIERELAPVLPFRAGAKPDDEGESQ
ncbi:MAG: hypothetical protein AUK47_01100 [Deltaproteobacteria bacterium CG2_30_63_29]|nr:MAG: hypothetical protein AUK47_01100 [Deltaproteobacteria bacterium CG2_30_63_29]